MKRSDKMPHSDNLLAQIISDTAPGGAIKILREFALELAEAGLEQLIISPPDEKFVKSLRHPRIRTATLVFGNPRADLVGRWRVKRLLRQARPKVVISWMRRAARFVPADGGYKHFGRLDDYYPVNYYKTAHKVLGVSPPVSEFFLAQDPQTAHRVETVPNFSPPPLKPIKRVGDKTPTVLSLGRFVPVKGYHLLIRAIAALPGVNLMLCGEGKQETELRMLARSLKVAGRVRIAPWQANITDTFNRADILAMPSIREPFGLPFTDGWAHKKAVVASVCAGPVSYMRHRHNGMLCDIDDVETLRQAIADLLADKALMRKVAENGHKEWREKFSPPVIINRWLKMFAREGLRVSAK